MRIIRGATVAAIVLLSAGSMVACGGSGDGKRFDIASPCDALTTSEVKDQITSAVTAKPAAVIDTNVHVCEWVPPNDTEYVLRLRTENTKDLIGTDATLNGRTELPKLGDGGFQGLSADGATQTIDTSSNGRSMSLECRLTHGGGVVWQKDGCLTLAQKVLDRMPE